MALGRSLADRVVIVTGASAGIGRDTSLALTQRGARVVGAARNLDRLEQVAAEAPGMDVVVCDVTDPDDRRRLVETTLERHGRVDGLVNNAGLGWQASVVETSPEKVRDLFDLNVIGLIDLTQLVLPGMLERGRGDVVNISSLAGYVSAPPFTVYCATKHAVTGLTNGLRRELLGTGVRAHLITPGPVRTEWYARTRGYEPGSGDPEHRGHGVPAAWVVAAILRCLRRPWPRLASVPRVFGAARIGEQPGVRFLSDLTLAAWQRTRR